jgi:Protein of unknown function (DUF3619)
VNKLRDTRQAPPCEQAALEARLGMLLAAQLPAGRQSVPHDISERLRVARETAVARARHSRRLAAAAATASATVTHQQGAAAILGGGDESWWVRLTALAPLVVLLAGLLFIHEWQRLEQIDATAEIDTAILSDDLPPAAYTDPGFVEFLSNSGAPAAQ